MNEPSRSQQYWYCEKSGEAIKAPLGRWLASIARILEATSASDLSSPCAIVTPVPTIFQRDLNEYVFAKHKVTDADSGCQGFRHGRFTQLARRLAYPLCETRLK